MVREKDVQLTDQQIEEIAERAAKVAFQMVYQEVGKTVLTKLAWLVGAAVVGAAMWLAGHGALPKA